MHVFDIQAGWIFGYLKESVHDKAGSGPHRIVLVFLGTTYLSCDMTTKKVYNRNGRISELIPISWKYREIMPWTVRNTQSTLHSHTNQYSLAGFAIWNGLVAPAPILYDSGQA